jgi:hypothetical protein
VGRLTLGLWAGLPESPHKVMVQKININVTGWDRSKTMPKRMIVIEIGVW